MLKDHMKSTSDGKYCTAAQLCVKYHVLTHPTALQYMPVNHTTLKQLSLLLGGQEGETSERGQAKGRGQQSLSLLQGNLCATLEAEPYSRGHMSMSHERVSMEQIAGANLRSCFPLVAAW